MWRSTSKVWKGLLNWPSRHSSLIPSAPMTGGFFFTRSPAFTSASQQEHRENQRFGGIAWAELLADYYQVAARHPTPHKKSAVCRSMIKDKSLIERHWFKALARLDPNKPPSERSGTIIRNVNRALSPKENKYFKLIDELSARRIATGKEAAKKDCRLWTERDELLARSSTCRDLIPAIEALSRRRGSQS